MTHRLSPVAGWMTWLLLATVTGGLYALIAQSAPQFEYTTPFASRPIPAILTLLAFAFAVYLLAALIAARWAPSRGQLGLIAGAAVVYRLILLPTTPIQEVDIYRYLWDGIVVSQGINPFRFPPQAVREARFQDVPDRQLARLVQVRDADPHVRTLLERIHYAELPSVYPPVSQAVFAAAAWTTPARATIAQRTIVLKIWLLGFDLATGGLVLLLLRETGRPLGMCVLYAWCPLVLKEFSNSGHLDVIAVFLTTLAVWLAIRLTSPQRAVEREETGDTRRGSSKLRISLKSSRNRQISGGSESPAAWRDGQNSGEFCYPHLRSRGSDPLAGGHGGLALAGGFVLALAVGAKLYPIWLFPLLAALVLRQLGWKWSFATSAVFLATVGLVLWPLLPDFSARAPSPTDASQAGATQPVSVFVATADPSCGLRTFLARWEMNDFLFMIAMENVKPIDLQQSGPQPWFSVLPQTPREALIGPLAEWFAGDRWQASFFVVRLASLLATLAIAAWCVRRALKTSDIAVWLESAFFTLAWFWFLSPTLNPWYWTWVLPLLAFARGRVWWWMSGVVLAYYLRFWFIYQFSNTPVAGTPYAGAAFFDYVVTWCEFGPWLACLILDHVGRRIRAVCRRRPESAIPGI